jgi:uncharacterized membrane protein
VSTTSPGVLPWVSGADVAGVWVALLVLVVDAQALERMHVSKSARRAGFVRRVIVSV